MRSHPSFAKAELSKLGNSGERAHSPPSRRRGGCAIKKMAPFVSWRRRGGCFKPPIIQTRSESITGSLKQPPRPLHKGCFAAFSLGRVHPSFAKEGYNQSHKTVVKNDTLPRSKPLRPATRRPSSVSAKRNLDSSALRRRGGCAIKKNGPVPYTAQTG